MTQSASVAKVIVTDNGAVRIVTINRPDGRNAVDPETAVLLRAAFTEFDADEHLHVAILTGNGGHFCAGFDLKRVTMVRAILIPAMKAQWGRRGCK
jgi:enoyl-CoA hydratase/carnithine racemase